MNYKKRIRNAQIQKETLEVIENIKRFLPNAFKRLKEALKRAPTMNEVANEIVKQTKMNYNLVQQAVLDFFKQIHQNPAIVASVRKFNLRRAIGNGWDYTKCTCKNNEEMCPYCERFEKENSKSAYRRVIIKVAAGDMKKHDQQHLTVIKELEDLKQDVIGHAISDTNDPKVKEEARKAS